MQLLGRVCLSPPAAWSDKDFRIHDIYMIITAYSPKSPCYPVFPLMLSEHHPSVEPSAWESLRAPRPEEGEDSGLHKSPAAASLVLFQAQVAAETWL